MKKRRYILGFLFVTALIVPPFLPLPSDPVIGKKTCLKPLTVNDYQHDRWLTEPKEIIGRFGGYIRTISKLILFHLTAANWLSDEEVFAPWCDPTTSGNRHFQGANLRGHLYSALRRIGPPGGTRQLTELCCAACPMAGIALRSTPCRINRLVSIK